MAERHSALASPRATSEVLARFGLGTKKCFGQNFLVNDDVIRRILELSDVREGDSVLEVGPGIGTLTLALLARASHVTSVECDPDLPAVLAETLSTYAERFSLVAKDALDLTQADLERAWAATGSFAGAAASASASAAPTASGEAAPAPAAPAFAQDFVAPNKFVANLPYAVAATLVLDYFERFPSIREATVMVQAEVADRMAAVPGTKNYGAYTVKLALFAKPAGRFKVGPGNFFPPPRVDSAVIRLTRRDAGEWGVSDADGMRAVCEMVDASFASRRKTIANSCKAYFSSRGRADVVEALPEIFAAAGVDPAIRGERLEVPDFVRLGRALSTVGE